MKRCMGIIFCIVMAVSITMTTGCFLNSKGGTGTIYTISREEGSGTRGAFTELFGLISKENGTVKDLTTKESLVISKTDVMISNVEVNKNSIGYVSAGSLSNRVKAVSIDGVAPTKENIQSQSYIISRPFILALGKSPSELSKDFIGFVLSKEGQEIVSGNYVAAVNDAIPYSGLKPSGSIVIMGSSSVYPVVEKLKEAYVAVNPSANIEVQSTDSSGGLSSLMSGTCDIAMSSRDLKDNEKSELESFSIAIDGIAVIVNNENPVTNLTKEQVKSIFDGSITNWGDLK